MGKLSLISNNPQVLAQYPQQAIAVAGGVAEVYAAARDAIHGGAKLLNHPLSGSIKPNQSPYRSLVLGQSRTGALDFVSLSLIEEAIATLRKLQILKQNYSADVLEDFQVIDLDLVAAAMKALPAEYY